MSVKVITGKVRFSFAHVFEPHQMEGDAEAKYSVSLIIPKTDKKTIAAIEKAIKEAAEEGKMKTFGGKIPAKLEISLRDGDLEKEDDENYAGSMFINAKSKMKPGVVDANLDPILDKEEFYSGCYGRASISFYAYNKGGNKGVAAALNNVQKLEDGEPLGAGGSKAEDDFATPYDELM